MKYRRMGAIVAVVFASLTLVSGPARAQSVTELEKELQQVLEELAERVREAGAQWRQSLRLEPAYENMPVSFMLEYKDALDLSPQQAEELRKLRSRFERKSIRREADIKVTKMELDELLDADTVDLGKAEKKVRELERLRGDEKLSRIRTTEAAKDLLNPEQRKKLAVLRREQN